MKILLHYANRTITTRLQLTCIAILLLFAGCKKDNNTTLKIALITSGLVNPIGIETDKNGNIWVSQTGTGYNDSKVILVKPDGSKYDAIVKLSSFKKGTEIQGAGHILLDKGLLYILSGNYLYKANVSNFKPGDAPLKAADIPFEDIGKFVLAYPFANNANDTHPYNLVKGPDGDLYIADAGANAILHRTGTNAYSVLAEVPAITNPTTLGPPKVESVPTGIIYDGKDFLVTTLLGFPFPSGQALVYKVSITGNVSVYQKGFTGLVDMAEGNGSRHLVLQYATFGAMGFAPNSGALLWSDGTTSTQAIGGLNFPVGIKQINNYTWYITNINDGTISKAYYD